MLLFLDRHCRWFCCQAPSFVGCRYSRPRVAVAVAVAVAQAVTGRALSCARPLAAPFQLPCVDDVPGTPVVARLYLAEVLIYGVKWFGWAGTRGVAKPFRVINLY